MGLGKPYLRLYLPVFSLINKGIKGKIQISANEISRNTQHAYYI